VSLGSAPKEDRRHEETFPLDEVGFSPNPSVELPSAGGILDDDCTALNEATSSGLELCEMSVSDDHAAVLIDAKTLRSRRFLCARRPPGACCNDDASVMRSVTCSSGLGGVHRIWRGGAREADE